jgi:hypothetical protein
MLVLISPVSVLAEQQMTPEMQPERVAISEAAEAASKEVVPCPKRAKGKGMMQTGTGRHGMGHDGMKHGKGKHEKHAEVVRRLDMIEARMAKIEAMLESLMRR